MNKRVGGGRKEKASASALVSGSRISFAYGDGYTRNGPTETTPLTRAGLSL